MLEEALKIIKMYVTSQVIDVAMNEKIEVIKNRSENCNQRLVKTKTNTKKTLENAKRKLQC